MQLPTDFITVAYLLSYAGMALAVLLIVQFTKLILLPALNAKAWSTPLVQLYAFVWATVLVSMMYWNQNAFNVSTNGMVILLILILVNAIVITIAAMGLYDAFVKQTKDQITQLQKNVPVPDPDTPASTPATK